MQNLRLEERINPYRATPCYASLPERPVLALIMQEVWQETKELGYQTVVDTARWPLVSSFSLLSFCWRATHISRFKSSVGVFDLTLGEFRNAEFFRRGLSDFRVQQSQ